LKREPVAGINAVDAVLEHAPERVVRVWVAGRARRLGELARRADGAGIAVETASAQALDRMAGGVAHQGVVAECRAVEPRTERDLDELAESAGPGALFLVLDQVQDPHNLGACLRTAAAAGATAVIAPRDRAAGLTPAARRAAAGAAEVLPLVWVANLARSLERLGRAGVWVIGLAGDAERTIQAVALDGPAALVLGGEERGLRRLTRERCDALARIPMIGPVDSLNVSVAAGIALFEALRQRQAA